MRSTATASRPASATTAPARASWRPSGWLERFRSAFGEGGAEQLITFDNIALAIAEYQRSAVFVDNPWSRYVRGDNEAISPVAKDGALFFFRPVAQGGFQCSQCHKGDFFTDERHHVTGVAQIGGGAGDGANGTDDFGRARQTGLDSDRYRYRTPSLLNVELTAPYGHAGAYGDLDTVFNHYLQPSFVVNNLIARRTWCDLPQFIAIADCAGSAPDVSQNSLAALAQMVATRTAAPADSLPVLTTFSRVPMLAFIEALTDPCLKDRACYGAWIPRPDEAPDGHQLNARDASGNPL
jgi:cytochrome c peroxidase